MSAYTFGTLVTQSALEFSDGYRTKQSELASKGFSILRAGDVRDGKPKFDGPDFVHADFAAAIGRKAVHAGDVVLTTKGTVGRTAFVSEVDKPAVYSPQLCYFRTDPDVLVPRYLYYWLGGPEFRSQADAMKSSTDMAPYISLSQLSSTRISIPPVATQQAIAEVLGALDDKIAANSELVKTSVRLCAALHQRALQSSQVREASYSDVAEIGGGGTPSTKRPEYWGGGVAWTVPTDITALDAPYLEDTSRRITEAGLAACSSPLYPVGSILMTSRATIGAFAVNQVPTAVNQGFIVVTPHDDQLRWWLFHEMQRRVPEYLNRANGATFLELPRGVFKTMHFDLPSMDVVHEFHETADSIHGRALAAVRESQTLAELRDTLLPALMDGTIRVKDAITSAEEVL